MDRTAFSAFDSEVSDDHHWGPMEIAILLLSSVAYPFVAAVSASLLLTTRYASRAHRNERALNRSAD